MMSNRLTHILLVLVVASLPLCTAPILRIDPASVPVSAGSLFTVDVTVSDITDLFAFQFDVGFDPLILMGTGISEGPFLSDAGSTFFIPGAIDNTSGTISMTANTLETAVAGVTGSGVLVSIMFQALQPGTSPITLSGQILVDSSFSGIESAVGDGSVTVTGSAVPEPVTFCLLAFAFGSMAFLRQRSGALRR